MKCLVSTFVALVVTYRLLPDCNLQCFANLSIRASPVLLTKHVCDSFSIDGEGFLPGCEQRLARGDDERKADEAGAME